MNITTVIQSLINFLLRTVLSKFMTVITYWPRLLIEVFKVKTNEAFSRNHEWSFWHYRILISSEKWTEVSVTKHSHWQVWNWNSCFRWLEDIELYTQWTKGSTSLNEFRSKIKTWKPESYPCRPCKIYLQRIGYLKVTN